MQRVGFKDFFMSATGNTPFPYQQRFANDVMLPKVLHVPTGAGKTAGMILAWVWRRFYHPEKDVQINTPRRLIYCLPMRVLVEQTRDNIRSMLARLTELDPRVADISITVLMGGESETDWMLSPEKEQIIIGTQDMLLSAALNRGYAMSRFRWPHAFGLLNNDCLWCFDEVQLMGSGFATSIQLEAFRHLFGTFGAVDSVWMSATLEKQWFYTPDVNGLADDQILGLSDEDMGAEVLIRRMIAQKTLRQASESLSDLKNKYPEAVAKRVLEQHISGKLTLVIVNQVERAQKIYRELKKHADDSVDLILMHSRFRSADRLALNQSLTKPISEGGRIIVSTQVVEAGVDISAAVLFTELAPWPSLVQRFGRCNRYGESEQADIFWFDLEEKDALPYSSAEIDESRKTMLDLEGKSVSPKNLPPKDTPMIHKHIIRRKDIIELFDTSPDLSGNDIDVSRFIRDGEDLDVRVYWRNWEGERPDLEMPAPSRDEMCSVQVWTAKEFLKQGLGWRWDHLGDKWQRVQGRDLRPGMVIMLHAEQGGYSSDLGWTSNSDDLPVVIDGVSGLNQDEIAADHMTYNGVWLTLPQHSDNVVAELDSITKTLQIEQGVVKELSIAARWHDAGKAHQVFQETMLSGGELPPTKDIIAKSPATHQRHSQRYFRHELASALAYMNCGGSDLVAYLVAAHHGKVRLSIRSLPNEKLPVGLPSETKIARGVWEGSIINAANLGGGVSIPELKVDLSMMEMGEGSWLEKTLAVRDKHGPFRLSFLEALIRSADIRASIKEGKEGK